MTKSITPTVQKILIPYDFSETSDLSLEHAVFMAKLLKAEITLLHIVETVSFTSAISHALGGFEKKIEDATIEKLDQLAKDIHLKSGITLNVRTEVGRIYKKICQVAKELEINLIVMGTHGASGYQQYSVGTNTSKVVMESPCPVLSVQTHAKQLGFKKILIPIDETAESRQKVPFGVEIASYYGSHITVAGLVNFSNEEMQRKFKIKVEQVEEYALEHNLNCDVKYLEGNDLAALTMQAANENECDLIMIMTEQEPSITGFLLGNYATKVVNGSEIPVLSVHPTVVDPDKISVRF